MWGRRSEECRSLTQFSSPSVSRGDLASSQVDNQVTQFHTLAHSQSGGGQSLRRERSVDGGEIFLQSCQRKSVDESAAVQYAAYQMLDVWIIKDNIVLLAQ